MKNLFITNGRINRSQFIINVIFSFMLLGAISWLIGYLSPNQDSAMSFLPIILIGWWYLLIVQTIKRLHDLDRNGSHIFFLMIPLYNLYFILVLLFEKGTVGPNKFDYLQT